MKKALLIITALVLVATQAHANELAKKYYLKVEAGGSFPTEMSDNEHYEGKKANNGAVFGLGVGYNFNKYLSADASFNHFPYHKFDKTVSSGSEVKQKFSSSTLMFNMVVNIPTPYCITPFFNAGAGFAHNNAGDYTSVLVVEIPGKTKDSFAWNVGAGANIKVNEWLTPYLAYKFFDLGKIQTQSYGVDLFPPKDVNGIIPITSHIRTHTAMLGMKYNF